MPERHRLAWAVRTDAHAVFDPDDCVFAPSRSKARALIISHILDAWGCTWIEAAKSVIHVRRWKERDVVLPSRHPLAQEIGPKLLDCVVHAYGGKRLRAGYRDYFYTHSTDAELMALVEHGLFTKGPDVPASRAGTEVAHAYFFLTDLGKLVAAGEQPEYPDA